MGDALRTPMYEIEYLAADGRQMRRIIQPVEIRPSGVTVSIRALDEDGGELRLRCDRFGSCVNLQTGEVITDPGAYFRDQWLCNLQTCTGGVPLADMIDALPIEGVGPATAETLARAFDTWDQFVMVLTAALREWIGGKEQRELYGDDFFQHISGKYGDVMALSVLPEPDIPSPKTFTNLHLICGINGIGPATVRSLLEYVATADLNKFASNYRVLPYTKLPQIKTALSGRTVVLTGEFRTLSRDEARVMAQTAGASVASAVSANVDLLIAGDSPGPAKMKRAQRLEISIIEESEFLEMTKTVLSPRQPKEAN